MDEDDFKQLIDADQTAIRSLASQLVELRAEFLRQRSEMLLLRMEVDRINRDRADVWKMISEISELVKKGVRG